VTEAREVEVIALAPKRPKEEALEDFLQSNIASYDTIPFCVSKNLIFEVNISVPILASG
jgi:cupin superfamily acireductone dioxygenase involved in methionine salvage